MSCCGSKAPVSQSLSGPAAITGYLVRLNDGRQATYLTMAEAEQARIALGSAKPVQPVYALK